MCSSCVAHAWRIAARSICLPHTSLRPTDTPGAPFRGARDLWHSTSVNARASRLWDLRSPGFGLEDALRTAQSRDHEGHGSAVELVRRLAVFTTCSYATRREKLTRIPP